MFRLCALAISTIVYTTALALAPSTELLNRQFFRLCDTQNGARASAVRNFF